MTNRDTDAYKNNFKKNIRIVLPFEDNFRFNRTHIELKSNSEEAYAISGNIDYGFQQTNRSKFKNKRSKHGGNVTKNFVKQKKKIFKGYLFNLYSGVVELCESGSLHGLKYVTSKKNPRRERFLWGLVWIVSFLLGVYNIYVLWNKWISSPFNLVLDDRYTPVYDVPFPAVIVCPENTAKKSVIDLSKLEDKEKLFAASLVCYNMPPENFSSPISVEGDSEIIPFLTKISPTCSDMIKSCRWVALMDVVEDTLDCCSKMFQPILTNNGVCFGFNMLTNLPKEILSNITNDRETFMWHPHYGYPPGIYESDNNTLYPKRIFSNRESFGLSVELYVNTSDSQEFCDGPEFGFKVLVASPTESAMISSYARIPMNRQTTFSVMPKKVTTDPAMESMKPRERKCYFDGEKTLKFFKYYTQNNCLLECETNHTLSICGCVPFFVKMFFTKIQACASYEQYQCMMSVRGDVNMKMIESFYELKSSFPGHPSPFIAHTPGPGSWCECWPACDDVSYNMEIFYSDFLKNEESKMPPWAKTETKTNEVTKLNIRFKDHFFFGFYRRMQYDNMDFLASCGGVLGLFLGFSIMSLFEVIYYIVLKPFFVWMDSFVPTTKQKTPTLPYKS